MLRYVLLAIALGLLVLGYLAGCAAPASAADAGRWVDARGERRALSLTGVSERPVEAWWDDRVDRRPVAVGGYALPVRSVHEVTYTTDEVYSHDGHVHDRYRERTYRRVERGR